MYREELWSATPQIEPTTLQGGRYLVATLFECLRASVLSGLFFLLVLLVLTMLLRKQWIVAAAFVVGMIGFLSVRYEMSFAFALAAGLVVSCFALLPTRLGFVTFVVAFFCWGLLNRTPITADVDAWYAGSSIFALLAVSALALYGFYTSLAGRPLFRDRILAASDAEGGARAGRTR